MNGEQLLISKSGIMLAIIWCFLFSGCISEHKAVNYMINHENVLSELCASKYPIKKTYIKGKTDTITKSDTTIIAGPIIPCPDNKEVKCPDNKIIYKNIYIDRVDTIELENTAKVYSLENKLASKSYDLSEANKNLENERTSKDRWRNCCLILFGVVVLFIGRKFVS